VFSGEGNTIELNKIVWNPCFTRPQGIKSLCLFLPDLPYLMIDSYVHCLIMFDVTFVEDNGLIKESSMSRALSLATS
jgi:hypothetical protein